MGRHHPPPVRGGREAGAAVGADLLVVTPGMGIGPEVTLRALAQRPALWPRVVLAGRKDALVAAGVDVPLVEGEGLQPAGEGLALWDPGDDAEPAEVAAIRAGVAACLDGRAGALVTGPIHKGRLAERGFSFRGHTDFLGHLSGQPAMGVGGPVMAFWGGRFGVALVTTHIPLCEVPAAVTTDAVLHTARTTARAWRDDLGVAHPRVFVCGLNPHAGEGGLLGTEEVTHIGPACDRLRAEGWDVVGPVSAETAFLEAAAGRVDVVIAMFHDQGLAPLKALDFGRTVNWSLGLPLVRTSVDHGTADALVGTGRAEHQSMGAAIALAERIVGVRQGGG